MGRGAKGQGGTAGGSKKKKKAGSKTAAHPAAHPATGKAGLNKMGMPPKTAQVSVHTHTGSALSVASLLH